MKLSSKFTAMFAAMVMAATAVPAVAFAQDAQAVTAETEVPGAKKDISECYVSDIGKYYYSNRVVEPWFDVWESYPIYENGECTNTIRLEEDKDYTVSYKNNDKIGTATVVIKGIGNYSGTKKVKFKIVPQGPDNVTASLKKGKVTVKWKKVDEATKYFVYYSENGGSVKKIGTTNKTKFSFSTSKLDTEHNSYNFYVASVTVVNGKNYVGEPTCDESDNTSKATRVEKTGKSEFEDIVMTVNNNKVTIEGFDFKKYMKMASKKDPVHVDFVTRYSDNRALCWIYCYNIIITDKTITKCKCGFADGSMKDVKFKWNKAENTLTIFADSPICGDSIMVSAHKQSKCLDNEYEVTNADQGQLFCVTNSEQIDPCEAYADMQLVNLWY